MNSHNKILIVDDVPDTIEILSRQLRNEGFNIIKAYNGKDGIEIARKERPDIVLMDVCMPLMDGFTATRIIKEENRVSI